MFLDRKPYQDIDLLANTGSSTEEPNEAAPSIVPQTQQPDAPEQRNPQPATTQVNRADNSLAASPLPSETAAGSGALQPQGSFTVGASGEVGIDYLFDGGAYRSEVAVFSLDGLDLSQAETPAFVQEAARRALSNVGEGFVAIRDRTAGAKFSGALTSKDYNHGDYQGQVSGSLTPGSQFGVLLVPQGTVAAVAQGTEAAIVSLSPTQPLVDLTGAGHTFSFEDRKLVQPQGGDYNDLVFQVRGATGNAPQLSDVSGSQWPTAPEGAALLEQLTQPAGVVTYSDRFFNPSEQFSLIGQIDNPEQVAAVEVWLRDRHSGTWQQVEAVTTFDEAGRFKFTDATERGAGNYEIKTVTRYASGLSETSETRNFTVLSLPEGEELSDRALQSLERVINLDRYDPNVLAHTQEWVVSLQPGQDANALAAQFGATNLGATGLVANTYRWELPEDFDLVAWQDWSETQSTLEYVYPLVSFDLEFYSPTQEPLVANSSHPDHQWHLTQSNVADVWNQGIEGNGVAIGVLDLGFEPTHLDLSGTYLGSSWNDQGGLSRNFDDPTQDVSSVGQHLQTKYALPILEFDIDWNYDALNFNYWSSRNLYFMNLGSRFPGSVEDLDITFQIDHDDASDLNVHLVAQHQTFWGMPNPQTQIQLLDGITSGQLYHFDTTTLETLFAQQQNLPEHWDWRRQKEWILAIADQDPDDGNDGFLEQFSIAATYDSSHGTHVAGVAAADGDNQLQGSGVSPGAGWAALQVGADGTDDLELAQALQYESQAIDIYHSSWGFDFFGKPYNPDDAGNFYTPLSFAWESVIEQNIQTGRDGKGNIYVFAGGNNGQIGGRVDYNPFANNRYTIAVGAVDHQYQAPTYSNPGASLLISAFSSDQLPPDGSNDITTTGPNNSSSNDFGGTSAAAPFVSGVVALMLEANPQLTWRDVQHILVETADRAQLQAVPDENPTLDAAASGWTSPQGEQGIQHHHHYGFGLVDALAAVEAAKTWQPLAPEIRVEHREALNELLNDNTLTFTITEDITLESVEVIFDATEDDPGDLEIILESPSGNQSVLSQPHNYPYPHLSDYHWTFTSLRHWGESSLGADTLPPNERGVWKLHVKNEKYPNHGLIESWHLNLYGTEPTDPINPNQHPEATPFNQAHIYTEDQPLTLTPIIVTDAEGDTVTVTLKLADAGAGQLSNGTIHSDAQGLWQITGTPEQVSTALANVQFIPTAHYNSDVTITTSVMDTEMASPLYGAIDLAGLPVNDAPELNGGHLSQTPVVGQTTAITYTDLLALTHATDIEGDPITFTIESLQSGTTLTSLPIAVAPGQALLWTPNSSGEAVSAFTVSANDGQDSSTPVTITAEVIAAPLPTATVILAPVAANATEGGTPGQFVIVRAGLSLDEPLTVNYTLSGSANQGTDYSLPATLTIPAGQESALITVQPLSDTLVESPETVTITLLDGPGYTVSPFFAPYTITIADSEPVNAPPILTSPITATPFENQTSVLDVNATDDTHAEGAGLTFSITGGEDATLFVIDPVTGQLDFLTAPDFESPSGNTYTVQVQVADADGLSATQEIAVTVMDVVETTNPPLNGTPQADTLIGAVGDDTIAGLGGDDQLRGEAGNDRLVGNDGQDALIGGDNDDLLDGGPHNDQLWGGPGHDRLYGGNSNDHLRGEAGNDRLEGNDGYDTLEGHDGDDELYGGNHNDHLHGGTGHDRLYGGSNNDHLRGETGNDILHGDDGYDTLEGHEGDDELYGGNHNDHLHGGNGIDILQGDAGDDHLYGDNDNDTLSGGSNNDQLWGGHGNDRLSGDDGNDSLRGQDGDDILFGGSNNDQLWGGNGNDRLYGNEDNDHLRGEAGDDRLVGGDGIDTLEGGDHNDVLLGGNHNDQLWGGNGEDELYGDVGNDHLRGESGHDLLEGGAGDDTLEGHDHDDILRGGEGNDQLWGGNGGDELYGDAGNDHLRGESGHDLLDGGIGDDLLEGHDHNDILRGGEGSDQFWGGHGEDELYGDAGNDHLRGEWGHDLLDGGIGDDTLEGHDHNDLLRGGDGADQLWGGNHEDELYGDAGNDHLRGESGHDRLEGGAGNDILEGHDHNDLLLGGDDNDQLWGHGGTDTLNGGLGDDILDGGGDADTFIFDTDYFGFDQINYFEGGIDTIDLAHFNGLLSLGALDSTNDGWVNGDDNLSLLVGNSLQIDLSGMNGGRITFNGQTQVAIADFSGLI
ncbi:MAG: S8 family serine peptidase [Cyanobacteria bacterium P01_G01_bin.54]